MPCSPPKQPSSSPDSHDSCQSSAHTCPQCDYWHQDHTKEIEASTDKYRTSTQSAARTKKYRFNGNLASGNITITLIFKLGTIDAALTAEQRAKIVADFKAVVGPAWSNKHSIKVTDPICGEKTLPVLFNVLWNPDDTADTHHYTVNVTTAPITANVSGSVISLNYADDVVADGGWVMTHEFGHTWGLPDEYFYSGVTAATITYKRADGTTEQITLEPSDDSIMRSHANTTILKRFFYLIEIEAQELFRSKSGRDVICEVV
jgi:hypothetical protein